DYLHGCRRESYNHRLALSASVAFLSSRVKGSSLSRCVSSICTIDVLVRKSDTLRFRSCPRPSASSRWPENCSAVFQQGLADTWHHSHRAWCGGPISG